MDPESFKQHVRILPLEEGRHARSQYIETFIDIESDWYREKIAVLSPCSDGYCYQGYLWDCLKSHKVIRQEQFVERIANRGLVFVMWDIHSHDKIPIEHYWKFGKSDVLELPGNLLVRNLHNLPDDLYVFDSSYSWTFISTHEDDGVDRLYVAA